jgi:hypothetical protein
MVLKIDDFWNDEIIRMKKEGLPAGEIVCALCQDKYFCFDHNFKYNDPPTEALMRYVEGFGV